MAENMIITQILLMVITENMIIMQILLMVITENMIIMQILLMVITENMIIMQILLMVMAENMIIAQILLMVITENMIIMQILLMVMAENMIIMQIFLMSAENMIITQEIFHSGGNCDHRGYACPHSDGHTLPEDGKLPKNHAEANIRSHRLTLDDCHTKHQHGGQGWRLQIPLGHLHDQQRCHSADNRRPRHDHHRKGSDHAGHGHAHRKRCDHAHHHCDGHRRHSHDHTGDSTHCQSHSRRSHHHHDHLVSEGLRRFRGSVQTLSSE